MFKGLKKSIRHLFFPYDKFTIEILTILNSSSSYMTLADVYLKCHGDPSLDSLQFVMRRLRDNDYVSANTVILTDPPRKILKITDAGRKILEKKDLL